MSQLSEHLSKLEPVLEPVLTQLRPYMAYLPQQLIELGRDYYSPAVFDEMILKLNVFSTENAPLLQLFIAKTLSLAILTFSSIVKLPQILAIVSQGSAKGLSFISILIETISLMITVAYNFRQNMEFMTFGEVAFVAVQNAIIMVLILYYAGKASYINAFIGLMAVGCYSLFGAPHKANVGVLSNHDVAFLAQLAAPLTIVAKLPQILNNFKNKSTGALSLISVGAGLLGTLVRLFTIMSSGIKDNLILMGFFAGVGLNAVLFIQILIFGGKKNVSVDKKNK